MITLLTDDLKFNKPGIPAVSNCLENNDSSIESTETTPLCTCAATPLQA